MKPTKVAMAIGAHPDDIEFYMAGTLVLLKRAGYETHYFNLASGNCGSANLSAAETKRRRKAEAQAAAEVLGARFHPSITNDLEVLYDLALLRKVAAVIREARPQILLTHSPQDYMEDHTNTCRLAVTAAFARGMPNFRTHPPRRAVPNEVAVYHCMPHGLCDPLRRPVTPGLFVNTTQTHETKLKALSKHSSQQNWLELSQGLNSYMRTMDEMSRSVGRMSGGFDHAEGWRRHLHLGFCAAEFDPLSDALGDSCRVNAAYELELNQPG